MRPTLALRLLVLAMVSVGCGSPAPHAEAPPQAAAPPPPPEPEAPQMRVGGQLGSIDPGAVKKTFTQLLPALQQCHVDGLTRVRYLGGEVRIVLRIGEDGKARYAYLEDSSLGDHDAEACMMHASTGIPWPRPDGGEAEVKNSFEFDPPAGSPAQEAWGSDAIAAQLLEQHAKIRSCRGKVQGVFKATAYVVRGPPLKKTPPRARPKHPRPKAAPPAPELRGRILAVGIAPPGPEGNDAVECLAAVILGMRVTTPNTPAAKVTFSL
jgi:hypothetical protein